MKHVTRLLLVVAAVLVAGSFVTPARAATTTEGTLVSISGTTPPATIVMQSGATTYTVNVTSATTLVRKYNGASTLDEFAVADLLQVRGTMTGTTIDATWIRNMTIQRRGAAQWGKVVSIDSTAKTFVLDPMHKKSLDNQTVVTSASTKVFQGNRSGEFSDIAVGMTVKVIGVWRKSVDTINADRILIKLTELNGKVSAVDCTSTPNTITMTRGGMSKLSNSSNTWTITLTEKTSLRDKRQLQISCADIKVGHMVSVRGLVTGEKTMNALNVWDKNIARAQKSWEGRIGSIDATAKSFTLTREHKDTLTVLTGAETIFVNDDGVAITFADLVVGHKVGIRGSILDLNVTANLVMDKDLPGDSD